MTEHILYSHKELIDLFSDCITKRRFLDKTVNGNKIKTWGGVNNKVKALIFTTSTNLEFFLLSLLNVWNDLI